MDNITTTFCNYFESTKNFISTKYNLMRTSLIKTWMGQRNNGCGSRIGTKFTKCLFVLLNVFYLMIALLLIAAGSTGQFAYSFYGLQNEAIVSVVSIAWIISGLLLLLVAVFGIIGACKNSVAWTNIYGVLMILTFVVQLASAIIGFTMISNSKNLARDTLTRWINTYDYFTPSVITMDWIQKSLQCCGIEGPIDWCGHGNYDNCQQTPESCCITESDYQNFTCDKTFQNGCLEKVDKFTLEFIFLIDSVALAVAVVQIVGIVSAFVVAKMIRRSKSFERTPQCEVVSEDIGNNHTTAAGYSRLDEPKEQQP